MASHPASNDRSLSPTSAISNPQTPQKTCGEDARSLLPSDNGSVCSDPPASSSGCSCTSTLRYSQEPWIQFGKRVENLCKTLWPAPKSMRYRFSKSSAAKKLRSIKLFNYLIPSPQAPLAEHFEGGDNNRITGITLPSYLGREKLMLRVPRYDTTRPDREVTILNYVRTHSSIPVPKIAAKDFSSDNPLGKPYVILHRVPGQDLDEVWDDISHAQRCIVAREVGRVVRTLLSMENPTPGLLEAQLDDAATPKPPNVVPFELHASNGELVEEPQPEQSIDYGTTLGFFETQFKRWRARSLEQTGGEIYPDTELYNDMLRVVSEMNEAGLFPDINCLCHPDLYPRNIMVRLGPDDHLEVTAILDWDEAVFAPKALNCGPPRWLWDDENENHLDENGLDPWPYELEGASELPSTFDKGELKCIFEENAGPEYARMAYDLPSRFTRILFRLATIGLNANEHYKAGQKVVREWNELHHSV